jgi:hypothetical protein
LSRSRSILNPAARRRAAAGALAVGIARADEPGSGRVSGARTSKELPRWPLASLASAAAALAPATADAHGFGQRYDLPIPLSFYLVGTAAAVVVSFLIVALFVRDAPRSRTYPRVDLLASPWERWIASPVLAFALKLIALAVFIVTITAGLRGDPNPYRNIAPTMLWTIGWVGLAYVSAFVGNLWAVINPWRTIFAAAETIHQGITGRPALSLRKPYPAALGLWPAFALLLIFSWIELIYPNPAMPQLIAWLALAYSVLTFTGMLVFGRECWLQHGELFTVVFGTFARFAPLDLRVGPQRTLSLRPFGVGLIEGAAASTSMMAFVLLLLSTVLYDGALGTPEWGRLESALAIHLGVLGEYKLMAIRTAGLIVFWLLFFGAYVGVSALMSAVTAGRLSPLGMARTFALTLVPIAIGYHLAHYLTFLLIQGQYIIPLASDPFGFGWNLFGTAGYRVDIAIVDARFAWYAALIAILTGHIAAVYLAHVEAMRVLDTRRAALRSQVPLTALMVVYTFVSLSILAEPIAQRRAPAQPAEIATTIAIPEDAVLPEPGTGRLLPVGAGRIARQKLTYRVLGSAFHDGSRMNAADLIYSYMFAYRWGARRDGENQRFDPLVAGATAVMRERLMGVRVLGTDAASKSIRFGDFEYTRELLLVEVYTSVAPLDPEQDAAIAPPWSTLPWHLVVLMEEAVARGWAAFSQAEAQRRGVPWLDLVRSEAMNAWLAALAASFARDGYRPDDLASLVSAEDARKRWSALAAFYQQRGHFLVANGPYRLERWTADSVSLEAFRDLSYPLGVGSYDAYAVPRRGYITKVERDGDVVRLSGDIELIEKHMRSYEIVRKPLPSIAVEVRKRAAPECRYIVTDGNGRVVLAGQVPLADDAGFRLDFSGKLPPGQFTLAAQIIVNGNAMNAEIRRIPIDVASQP